MPHANLPEHVDESPVVELRCYTLHPGRREALVALFDAEFVETQEAEGLQVMGQFRDLDRTERFVWLRGFAGMPERAHGLAAFYGGPVWAQHRDAANATMVDSDDVHLLRPAWPGAGLQRPTLPRPAPGATVLRPGVLDVAVFPLAQAADAACLRACRASLQMPGPGRIVAWYATEPAPNNFPRLPVHEGEPVLVALVVQPGTEAPRAFDTADPRRNTLAPWGHAAPQLLRLAPTARSFWPY